MTIDVGAYVVIRKLDDPERTHQIQWSGRRDSLADGESVYTVFKQTRSDTGQPYYILDDPYSIAASKGFALRSWSWHESWLKEVVKVGDYFLPKAACAGEPEQEEAGKGGGLYWSETHPIIDQKPGETDKQYLRRILGGR